MTAPSALTNPEIEARLATLPAWSRRGETITRTIVFPGFPEAVAFVSRLVEPAESMQHHPDIDVRYNRVVVTLSTHDSGGLRASDFTLAERIDVLMG